MIVKPTTPTYRDRLTSLKADNPNMHPKWYGGWTMATGALITFAPIAMGQELISPLGAVTWTIMGGIVFHVGYETLRKGKMEMIHHLRTGEKNAVTRQQLVNATGLSDRAVRRQIEILRNKGIPIISRSDGKGYWIAQTVSEISAFITEADSRAKSQRYPELRRLAGSVEGQVRL